MYNVDQPLIYKLQTESLSISNDIHVGMNKMILKVEKKLTIVHMLQ